jgi:hypothetical protein
VGGDAGAHLQADGGVGGEQRQHGVGGRARPCRVRAQRGEQLGRQRVERARVVAGGALDLARDVLLARGARGLRVEPV